MKLSLMLSAALLLGAPVFAEDKKPETPLPVKKVLLVTHSRGFIHDSVGVAEEVLKKVGPKAGLEVTCFRYTNDPRENDGKVLAKYSDDFRKLTGLTVAPENCGRIDKATLAKFDAVIFFTTGNPLNEAEVADLVTWVKAGGALIATHCGSDTLYPNKDQKWAAAYGDLVGAYFDGHPWHQKIKLNVEDGKHAGAKGFKTGDEITDEIYQFRPEPYSRNKLHIVLSVDNSSIDIKKGKRKDNDYAVAWCQQVEKGRTFYTSLGHRREVWNDPRFQEHLLGAINWTLNRAEGESAPTGPKK